MSHSARLIAVLITIALAAAAAAGALSVLRNDSISDDETPEDDVSKSGFMGGPASGALYLSGKTLSRVDLDSGATERIGRMPTLDVHASPVTPWLAYVVPRAPQTEQEPDFISDPVLRVINVDTNKDREIGDGFNPLWHPAAPKLAYLQPTVERQCSGESCEGLFEIATFDVTTGERAVLTKPGRLNPLAWSGEQVLFADAADLSTTYSVGPDGALDTVDLAPSELWDASPDGRFLVRSAPGEAALIDLETNDETAIEVGNGVLAEGAWAPDSRHFAAAVLNEGRTKAHAVVVDASDGGITPYTVALPGVLNVRWSPDAREFGFLTFVGATNRVELNRCQVDRAASDCTIVGEQLRRTSLLRFD
ncbi:MAG: hypothetical protein ACRDJB_10950 [Actinomycetota bacterium]